MSPRRNPSTTQRQGRRIETPARSYTVTGPRGHRLLVRRPDGRPMRVRPSGSLLEAGRIASIQSYLHVPAS
jgi:hypothetical protein